MDKPAKATKPAARKRAASPRATPPRSRKPRPSAPPVEVVVEPVAVETRRHVLRVIAGFGIVLAAVVAGLLFVDRSADAPSDAPVAVSAAELTTFAAAQETPVYWAGPLEGRPLELTRTDTGTFVRYLLPGSSVGSSGRSLTVATYPMQNAYATATRRAKGSGMSSSPTENGGLAVWSKAHPTSVYVAFRGVPALVEVYAPQAENAQRFAVSSSLRRVR